MFFLLFSSVNLDKFYKHFSVSGGMIIFIILVITALFIYCEVLKPKFQLSVFIASAKTASFLLFSKCTLSGRPVTARRKAPPRIHNLKLSLHSSCHSKLNF